MRRTLVAFTLLACCLGFGVASAKVAAPAKSAAPAVAAVASVAPTPAIDPYLGGSLKAKVPMAHFCTDNPQCKQLADGTPCDTPAGCVCGFNGFKRVCGHF